ncbi:amino acid adenylation domain-containing protein [Cellulomonas shaoxiangyii]|uniref:Phenyloxazoline synthase MbtB n=3 Tax=Cellulomonas shaoxiangyii TaxID=2566013 RepID=A0A4P7SL06_9CELL|nr:amino acid adenylation domain-containing protein [Cellulomonas shaoxiangyii]
MRVAESTGTTVGGVDVTARGEGADRCTTVVDTIMRRADEAPGAPAVTLVGRDGADRAHLTRAELAHRVRATAAGLQQVAAPGDRAVVVQAAGVDYVVSFLASVAAGLVPVTSHPRALAHGGELLGAVVADATPAVVLTAGEATASAAALRAAGRLGDVRWIDVADCTADTTEWRRPEHRPDDVAFLQYTSGTTRRPRGVMVGQGALAHNVAVLARRLGHDDPAEAARGVSVSWLPPFHDMGLVAGILEPLASGCHAVLLAPATFAADPYRWLEAITRHGGTYAYAPTFALDLCTERVTAQERATLDLSTVRSLVVGAEPLRAPTFERFVKTFGPCGMRAASVHGGYGLAESTLAVAVGALGRPAATVRVDAAALADGEVRRVDDDAAPGTVARTLVVSGQDVDPRQDLRIVDPATGEELPPGRTGEIWVAGPSVALGYWGRPELSGGTFGARTATGDGPFLRTGDLGFVVPDPDGGPVGVVVCGRRKDLIIVRGRNVHPQDVEHAAAEAHPAVRQHLCAASSLDVDGEERVLVAAEVARDTAADDLAEVVEAVCAAVLADLEVEPGAVVLLRPGGLPRTTSGKVQRGACAERFTAGTLAELHRWVAPARPATVPAGPVGGPAMRDLLRGLPATLRHEVALADVLRRVTGGGADRDRPLVALGVDSLRAMALQRALVDDHGTEVPLADLLAATPARLAERLVAACDAPTAGPAAADAPPSTDAPPIADADRADADRADADRAGADRAGSDRAGVRPAAADPGGPDGEFALTPVQQAYLVGRSPAHRLGGVAAHWYVEVDADGVDTDRLVRAFDALVGRHEMLRAVVTPGSGQRVLPVVPSVPVRHHDLADADAPAREAHLAQVRERLSHAVRDPAVWPLVDLETTDLGSGRRRVHLGVDLLVADAASLRVLLDEWRQLYASDADARVLPALRTSFRDGVRALDARAAGPAGDRAERYWRDRLETLPAGPDLPWAPDLDTAGPPRFTRLRHRLDPAAWGRLRERAAARGLTPATVLATAWAAAVGTWSRTGRFHVTLTVADRPGLPGIEGVVGDFTGVEVLEVDLTGDPTVADLAAALQARLAADLEHRAVPGVEVLRLLVRRDGRRAPAPGVVLTCALGQGGGGDDLPTRWLGEEVFAVSQTPQVALDHQAVEAGGALLLSWDVVEAALPDGVARRLVAACADLLDRLAADDGAWSQAARTPDHEHLAEVAAANATQGPAPRGALHGPLVERVREDPDAPAVLTADRAVRRGELLAAAGRAAAGLRAAGAGPGTTVAVLAATSPEQVAGVLAALLTGAAYLPVDPALPRERQDHLVRHGGAVAVVVGPAGDPAVAAAAGVPAVPADLGAGPDVGADAAADAGADPGLDLDTALALADVPVDPDAPAYVIYTSGSTGVPKGVTVTHAAALNTCVDLVERYDVGAGDRVLGLSSMSFDLSVWDVFGVLGAGGALVLPDPADRRDPARWVDLMAAHGVTLWNTVPALMGMLLEHLDGAAAPAPPLRLVLLSGDWIPVDLPARLARVVPGARLVALGGATEAAIWSIAHEPGVRTPAGWDSVPYGHALRNQRVHVLDDRGHECPAWVTGEIHLAGVGLALGYRGDAERTARSFVTHPATGERLYRTGDLGRWRPGGLVEFLGREDGQVKIGGHRVELGEVEAALARHPRVRAAVASAVGPRHRRRLVAHVVPEDGAGCGAADARALADDVRAHAATVLAAALVPSAVLVRPDLPLTANGKVDRAALAQAAAAAASAAPVVGGVPPGPGSAAGATAELLRRLTAAEVGGDVGIDTHLFELGVDSVGLVRLHRRLLEATGRPVPLTAFFEHPTVRALADHLDGREEAPTGARAPRRAARRSPAPAAVLADTVRPDALELL